MKTKAQIVQSLLEDKKITAEEAVTLLAGEKEYIYVPTSPYPFYPSYPSYPSPSFPIITVGPTYSNSN